MQKYCGLWAKYLRSSRDNGRLGWALAEFGVDSTCSSSPDSWLCSVPLSQSIACSDTFWLLGNESISGFPVDTSIAVLDAIDASFAHCSDSDLTSIVHADPNVWLLLADRTTALFRWIFTVRSPPPRQFNENRTLCGFLFTKNRKKLNDARCSRQILFRWVEDEKCWFNWMLSSLVCFYEFLMLAFIIWKTRSFFMIKSLIGSTVYCAEAQVQNHQNIRN